MTPTKGEKRTKKWLGVSPPHSICRVIYRIKRPPSNHSIRQRYKNKRSQIIILLLSVSSMLHHWPNNNWPKQRQEIKSYNFARNSNRRLRVSAPAKRFHSIEKKELKKKAKLSVLFHRFTQLKCYLNTNEMYQFPNLEAIIKHNLQNEMGLMFAVITTNESKVAGLLRMSLYVTRTTKHRVALAFSKNVVCM